MRGQVVTFRPEEDPRLTGTLYTPMEEWNNDLRFGAAYDRLEGLQARYGFVGGIVYPNSIPRGGATWSSEMVGLDQNNLLVRGDASLRLVDFGNPRVDVVLSPHTRPAMTWRNLTVVDGGFRERRSRSDYIKGEFYGSRATEAGGVFERRSIVGAFGAKR